MQKIGAGLLFLLLAACSGENSYRKAENSTDAAREFIRASLDGNYRKAAFYMLTDSTNDMLLDAQQRNYHALSPEEKESYREASIRPLEIRQINDSTASFKYYHSSNIKDTTTLRVVRLNGEWLVDLKSIIKP